MFDANKKVSLQSLSTLGFWYCTKLESRTLWGSWVWVTPRLDGGGQEIFCPSCAKIMEDAYKKYSALLLDEWLIWQVYGGCKVATLDRNSPYPTGGTLNWIMEFFF